MIGLATPRQPSTPTMNWLRQQIKLLCAEFDPPD
jgi:hypothetical protein